jgi:hypothetical protein
MSNAKNRPSPWRHFIGKDGKPFAVNMMNGLVFESAGDGQETVRVYTSAGIIEGVSATPYGELVGTAPAEEESQD